MDRVLLIIDDIQYSRHVEMTFRKVGFDVETLNSEYNITETILTFNPDYVICRGNTNRLSVQSVGRKLKESSSKFFGKVFLIFPEAYKVTPEDVTKLRMDLVLFDPMSTLKLAMHLFSFAKQDFEFARDKLLKFAITDSQFRIYEQQILKNAGKTIDSEIQIISSMESITEINGETGETKKTLDADELSKFVTNPIVTDLPLSIDSVEIPPHTPTVTPQSETPTHITTFSESKKESLPLFPEPDSISDETIMKINMEIQALAEELPLRIDTYNHMTKTISQDIASGLSKKQTRKESNSLLIDLIKDQKTDEKKSKKHHDEKVIYAQALFKKKS